MNNKDSFSAKFIAADPNTDIALLKINTLDLSPIKFYNSDLTKVGEWVLAVGNPYNLTSAVTAGIISAKGRNINILHNPNAVESFIQTDAVINPGNSGGAPGSSRGAPRMLRERSSELRRSSEGDPGSSGGRRILYSAMKWGCKQIFH